MVIDIGLRMFLYTKMCTIHIERAVFIIKNCCILLQNNSILDYSNLCFKFNNVTLRCYKTIINHYNINNYNW